MSSADTKTLIYDTLKTLNASTEDSKNDFFNKDFYVPDSFSTYFSGVISEQDIQDAINQLQQERRKESEKKGKNNQTENSK
ncbi:hypothetical protein RhiirA1_419890 [Rhizophagus irregularis]|uniref:Uncharacterized protein n=4 Tax=Rhizophagus irregularis TaxID=588596 RepID=A0A2N0RRJ0_9GLOM|nr:hypothetical protein RirG_071840 [Rhizophagus irregularis DAOM 197198w]PKC65917.1 hypothetical protein RhiirA1_419890 [Rhizophagus irregularis]UZO19415.1 hypothetical protein OCT59_010711 [Rhizophagus irregularis]CAB4375051.1 unnamed protein product [Rhizophagus irregularis]CAB4486661.1 unnamed protein product [Rhizophagus irregularis]